MACLNKIKSKNSNLLLMKKASSTILSLLFAVALLSSCTVAKISGRGAVPVLLNQPAERMDLTEHIVIKKNVNFDYTASYDVSEHLAREVAAKKPDAVINTTVTIKQGIDNYFINLFTFGLAASRKVVIEADFVKAPKKATTSLDTGE